MDDSFVNTLGYRTGNAVPRGGAEGAEEFMPSSTLSKYSGSRRRGGRGGIHAGLPYRFLSLEFAYRTAPKSMLKMTEPSKHHRHTLLVAIVDGILVLDGSPRLNYRLDPRAVGYFNAIGEWEKCIRRHNGTVQ
jgi:hypothetical protein